MDPAGRTTEFLVESWSNETNECHNEYLITNALFIEKKFLISERY